MRTIHESHKMVAAHAFDYEYCIRCGNTTSAELYVYRLSMECPRAPKEEEHAEH